MIFLADGNQQGLRGVEWIIGRNTKREKYKTWKTIDFVGTPVGWKPRSTVLKHLAGISKYFGLLACCGYCGNTSEQSEMALQYSLHTQGMESDFNWWWGWVGRFRCANIRRQGRCCWWIQHWRYYDDRPGSGKINQFGKARSERAAGKTQRSTWRRKWMRVKLQMRWRQHDIFKTQKKNQGFDNNTTYAICEKIVVWIQESLLWEWRNWSQNAR